MLMSILLISFLVVVWWIALWGLIEIVLKSIVGNSVNKMAIAYVLMIAFVLSIVYMYPSTIDRFL
jgi:hypothetical protein